MASPRATLSLQWHLTTACGKRCKHCYMYDERSFGRERAEPLDLAGVRAILASIRAFEAGTGVFVANVTLTGGDPLLFPGWRELAGELRADGRSVRFLGNPETLTPELLDALANLGAGSFQVSLDGLAERHDAVRGPGSFAAALGAIEALAGRGIPAHVMFTLYRENAADLLPVMRLLADTRASAFAFDFGCLAGNARATLHAGFSPEEARGIVDAYLDEKAVLAARSPVLFTEKPNLLRLARLERGTTCPATTEAYACHGGCRAGWNAPIILSDGTALACRRLPVAAGDLKRQSFEEVYLGSPLLRRFRRESSFAGCQGCDLFKFCRGCPAYTFGVVGDPFAPYPLCDRAAVHARAPASLAGRFPEVRLDASNDEELELVLAHYLHRETPDRVAALFDEAGLAETCVALLDDAALRRRFLADPVAFVRDRGRALSREALVYLADTLSDLEHVPVEDLRAYARSRLTSGRAGVCT